MRDARTAVLLTVIATACAHGDGTTAAIAPVPPPAAAVAPSPAPSPALTAAAVDFSRDVRPILERRCQPCHFTGGVMYGRLPFDREATVHELGEKLFTRIEAADEQRTIRALLARSRQDARGVTGSTRSGTSEVESAVQSAPGRMTGTAIGRAPAGRVRQAP